MMRVSRLFPTILALPIFLSLSHVAVATPEGPAVAEDVTLEDESTRVVAPDENGSYEHLVPQPGIYEPYRTSRVKSI